MIQRSQRSSMNWWSDEEKVSQSELGLDGEVLGESKA